MHPPERSSPAEGRSLHSWIRGQQGPLAPQPPVAGRRRPPGCNGVCHRSAGFRQQQQAPLPAERRSAPAGRRSLRLRSLGQADRGLLPGGDRPGRRHNHARAHPAAADRQLHRRGGGAQHRPAAAGAGTAPAAVDPDRLRRARTRPEAAGGAAMARPAGAPPADGRGAAALAGGKSVRLAGPCLRGATGVAAGLPHRPQCGCRACGTAARTQPRSWSTRELPRLRESVRRLAGTAAAGRAEPAGAGPGGPDALGSGRSLGTSGRSAALAKRVRLRAGAHRAAWPGALPA